MKGNKIEHPVNHSVLAIVALVVLVLLGVGVLVGYEKLRALWLDQCVIRDMEKQVSITSGKMVFPDVLAAEFGLRVGANLGLIDFDERRRKVLKKIPNLRAIAISRQLPDKVTLVAEERTPLARVNLRRRREITGKVVDAEGVVFVCQRGTAALPTLREAAPGTAPGGRLSPRAFAALRLLERGRDPDYQELGILEVDVTQPDYLIATLGDYSIVKICWEGMDEATAASARDLDLRLSHLRAAIRSRVAEGTRIWNATDPSGRIYADTKGNLR